MYAANLPGFSAGSSLYSTGSRFTSARRYAELSRGGPANDVVPAMQRHCEDVPVMYPCGSALPGYPIPMCWGLKEICWWEPSPGEFSM